MKNYTLINISFPNPNPPCQYLIASEELDEPLNENMLGCINEFPSFELDECGECGGDEKNCDCERKKLPALDPNDKRIVRCIPDKFGVVTIPEDVVITKIYNYIVS